jgi:hypothetical protein
MHRNKLAKQKKKSGVSLLFQRIVLFLIIVGVAWILFAVAVLNYRREREFVVGIAV